MSFDWTINVGNILQMATMVGGGLWVIFSLKGDVRVLRHDISYLKQAQTSLGEAFKQLGTVLTQVAVQDTRLSMIEKSLDEMRHGHGFIKGKSLAKTKEV